MSLNGWQRLWIVLVTLWTLFWVVLLVMFWPAPHEDDATLTVRFAVDLPTGGRLMITPDSGIIPPTKQQLDEMFRQVEDARLGGKLTASETLRYSLQNFHLSEATPFDLTLTGSYRVRGGWLRVLGNSGSGALLFAVPIGASADDVRQAYLRELDREAGSDLVALTFSWWLAPPLALYALGWSIAWVMRGFAQG